jgi:hypothetical protein
MAKSEKKVLKDSSVSISAQARSQARTRSDLHTNRARPKTKLLRVQRCKNACSNWFTTGPTMYVTCAHTTLAISMQECRFTDSALALAHGLDCTRADSHPLARIYAARYPTGPARTPTGCTHSRQRSPILVAPIRLHTCTCGSNPHPTTRVHT